MITIDFDRWTLVNNGTIVQTNIDHWSMNQDEDVMFSTDRRSTARRLLKEMTVINEDALWKVSRWNFTSSNLTFQWNDCSFFEADL